MNKKPQFSKPHRPRPHPAQGSASRHRRPDQIFSFQEADARIYDAFRHHGFGDYPHEKRQQLTKFYEVLMNHQLSDNVTRLVKIRDVAIKHFIDSLIITRYTELKFPLIDIGTGPGFPGVPLKIEFPDQKIILAEGVRKRVDFLKAVREELKLKNLDIMGRYITKEFVYPVKGAITRAVEDISLTLENVSQSLEVGGRLYLMKGPNVDDELKNAKKNWSEFYTLVEDHAYDLPQTPNHRRLIVFEKIKTPQLEMNDEEE